MQTEALTTFGAIAYTLAALSFLAITCLMLVSWRGNKRGGWLILASAATTCTAILLAMQSAKGTFPFLLVYFAEVVQDVGWIAALVAIAGATTSRPLKTAAIVICAVTFMAAPVFFVLESRGVMYLDSALLLSRSQLACSMIGLILIEQIFRNSTHSGRHAIKYFAAGVGTLFAYDLFLYSHAELFRALSPEAWNARGLVMACSVPLIALSARRSPDWSLDVFVSRQVIFYSSAFMVAGAYLFVMALGGYYVRQFGGEWGRVGQIVFFVGAAVVLACLLASGTLRRHAIVFISKHFYRNKYDYRIEWLRFIQTLSSTEGADVRRTAVQAIAQIFASPGGVLFLRDESGGAFVPAAAWPIRLTEIPRLQNFSSSADLPSFLARTHWIVDLEELRNAPNVYSNISLPEWMSDARDLRIVGPLLQLNELVGFICLYAPPPPFALTYEDRDLLKTVGRHVATHIAQDDASRKLAESRQFEAYNRLTAFMMHDLKNSVAQLKLVVENSARHKSNPVFIDDAIDTIRNTVDRMSRLIEQLKGANKPERVELFDLAAVVQEAADRCKGRLPQPSVRISASVLVRANVQRLGAVIEHVIRNAQDATAENGSISVEVGSFATHVLIRVTDTGSGMDADFLRDRLFRPFDSTKGSKGMGIGAYQVREYIRQLRGNVEVQSSPGSGTQFSITLPRFQEGLSVETFDTTSERATS